MNLEIQQTLIQTNKKRHRSIQNGSRKSLKSFYKNELTDSDTSNNDAKSLNTPKN